MTAGERFKSWIEGLSNSWKDQLRGWFARWFSEGAEQFTSSLEPDTIAMMRATLEKLRDNPNTPPEMRDMINKSMVEGNLFQVLYGWMLALITAVPALLGSGQPMGNLFKYDQDWALRSERLGPSEVLSAWRRDKLANEKYFNDLREKGWSDARIEALKFITEIIPGVPDLIRMSVREAFSPEIAEKFGQYQDPPTAVYPWAEKQGLSKEWVDRYWAAHWELPGSTQGFELLHRGIITEEDLKLLLRALDVMPYWRDKLIQASWNIPTRVDVRRFWDMRTIDESRLREIYTGLGYHGQDLEDYVLWTKIYVDFPDLLARYKNGWITLDQVKSELVAMGMKPDRASTMIEEKIKKAAPERTAGEKNLTKSDIYKGVKQARITRDQGLELLMALGYDADESDYLLDINIPADQEDQVVAERQLTKADVLEGLKEGVIDRATALQKLLELRYSLANADLLLKIFDAQVTVPAEPRLKEASKADIITGVKKGVITQEEGYLMLVELGFDPDAALFILTVQTEESPFSPINFEEFKDRAQKYRRAAGLEGTPMNEELKKAAGEVVRLTNERDILQKSIEAEKRGLLTEGGLPAEATARLTQLQTSLRQTEAELARVKSEYNRLVVEAKRAV